MSRNRHCLAVAELCIVCVTRPSPVTVARIHYIMMSAQIEEHNDDLFLLPSQALTFLRCSPSHSHTLFFEFFLRVFIQNVYQPSLIDTENTGSTIYSVPVHY